MNVIVVVSKRALIVIHNLSDSHLRHKELACVMMLRWTPSPKTPGCEVFRENNGKTVRNVKKLAHLAFMWN
jgi:hypothetical protein